jgi:nucleoside-diphosphate-sugar epimerase
MKSILLTGATGFLGSNLVATLIESGYEIIALKRKSSAIDRCKKHLEAITWIDIEDFNLLTEKVASSQPETLIHFAWNGVKAADRNDWAEQEKNITFLVNLLTLLKGTSISKVIALGSQAEYGQFDGVVNEESSCEPNTAYGAMKVCASVLLKSFSEQNNLKWYWLRIFSVFGPGEDIQWLIPSAIKSLIRGQEMDLTPCEQAYDYLYIEDFSKGILSVVQPNSASSGIYIFSSGTATPLKDLLNYLEKKLSPEKKLLNIGKMAYRPNQVMQMQGNPERFFKSFGFTPSFTVNRALDETMDFYIKHRDEY